VFWLISELFLENGVYILWVEMNLVDLKWDFYVVYVLVDL
jgi:hypothetical protein